MVYVKEKLTWKPLGYLKATGTFTRLASDVPEGWNTRTASLVVSSKLKYRPAVSFDITIDTNHSFMCNELAVSSPQYIEVKTLTLPIERLRVDPCKVLGSLPVETGLDGGAVVVVVVSEVPQTVAVPRPVPVQLVSPVVPRETPSAKLGLKTSQN